MTANAAARLIQHYVDNFRELPWRSAPGAAPPDPYRVWLSEVMLQQTTVAAVRPRFDRFVARWPTIEALAAASDEQVLGEWAGLGYYARARHLIACARQVVRRGGFPRTARELRALPGIGAYTAAAIAAIAFGERASAVDTNVQRVVARLHALSAPSRRQVEQLLVNMMPERSPGDFIQALMDVGAGLCRPRRPDCAACPLHEDCAGFASGMPDVFPRRQERSPRPHRHGIAWWVESSGRVWLVRRPARGLLAGMAALPGSDWTADLSQPADAIATVRHVFTHFSLDLHLVPRSEAEGVGWWQPLSSLGEAGLPTLYRRAADQVMTARQAA